MYHDAFQLREEPFSITPDPRFMYLSRYHQEGLAHLLYSIQSSSGFVLLTGEVGAGKTTLSRCLLEQLPANVDLALIFNPKLSAAELVASICDELRIEYPKKTKSLKVLINVLNRHLVAAHSRGRKVVVVIDEAQNLSPELLEQVRLLTNLETATQKLLQIILIGQPELLHMLEKKELRQLAQRVTARFHIGPLDESETDGYIRHRLAVAGAVSTLFEPKATRLIFRLSGGVPRLVNKIGDRSLLGAFAQESPQVTPEIVHQAAIEVLGPVAARAARASWLGDRRLPLAVGAGLLLLLVGATGGYWWNQRGGEPAAGSAAGSAASAVASAPDPGETAAK
ncbi:MAG: AAA family ATPase, partial [Magnetococcales bacterium]|nr:AAA family ATPase [Magnetococcales bacterium]